MYKSIVGITSSLALASASFAAQHGHPFSAAALGKVDYRATPLTSVVDCAAMLPNDPAVTVTAARLIAAQAGKAPAHCRIDGTINGNIGFQVNLPLAWNGRLYMWGNGGFSGEDFDSPEESASRDAGLANGFATVHTDTGHKASELPGATFARFPGKMVDHGYLAVHLSVQWAKRAVR